MLVIIILGNYLILSTHAKKQLPFSNDSYWKAITSLL